MYLTLFFFGLETCRVSSLSSVFWNLMIMCFVNVWFYPLGGSFQTEHLSSLVWEISLNHFFNNFLLYVFSIILPGVLISHILAGMGWCSKFLIFFLIISILFCFPSWEISSAWYSEPSIVFLFLLVFFASRTYFCLLCIFYLHSLLHFSLNTVSSLVFLRIFMILWW